MKAKTRKVYLLYCDALNEIKDWRFDYMGRHGKADKKGSDVILKMVRDRKEIMRKLLENIE